jgi:hypothetical protein
MKNQFQHILRATIPGILMMATPLMANLIVPFAGKGHSYEVVSSVVSWNDAWHLARAKGGYLATITTQAENDFITSLLPSGLNAWLGGYQPSGSSEPSGNWRWVTGEPFQFQNWNGGEPNNGVGHVPWDEPVLEIYGITTSAWGRWNDAHPMQNQFGYVIEYGGNFPIGPSDMPEPGTSHPVPEPASWITGLFLLVPICMQRLRALRRADRGPC